MKGLRKRVICISLSLVLAIYAPLSCSLKVKAAALPATAESAESLMALLDVLVNAMAAGGAIEYVADYDNDMDLLDGFMKFARSMSLAGNPPGEMEFVLADGTTTTLDDLLTDVEDGVITLPNEQQWGQYRVGFGDDFAKILEAWEERGSGTGGSSEPEPEEPKFNKLKALAIGSGLVGSISAFILALKNGEVEGLAPETYFEADDEKLTKEDIYMQSNGQKYTYYFSTIEKVSGYCSTCWQLADTLSVSLTGATNQRSCVTFTSEDSFKGRLYVGSKSYGVGSGFFACGHKASSNSSFSDSLSSCNIPIFSTYEAAQNYLKTGEGYENALNYKPSIYNYPSLANSLSNSLASWTGTRLSPATLQKTYTGVKNAYETEIKPNVDAEKDTDTNTKTYVDTVTKVVTETVVKPDTDTGTEPGTETKPNTGTTTPGTGTGTGTGTDTDADPETDVENYKRDLRLVFPFCLPFDLIALLDALDAEPVTPCFDFPFVVDALDINMTIKLDLAFLDDVAEKIRLFETIGFVISLITVTHKMIKW